MIISCPSCHTAYNLPEHVVTPTGTKICCKRCRHLFWVRFAKATTRNGEKKAEIFYKDGSGSKTVGAAERRVSALLKTHLGGSGLNLTHRPEATVPDHRQTWGGRLPSTPNLRESKKTPVPKTTKATETAGKPHPALGIAPLQAAPAPKAVPAPTPAPAPAQNSSFSPPSPVSYRSKQPTISSLANKGASLRVTQPSPSRSSSLSPLPSMDELDAPSNAPVSQSKAKPTPLDTAASQAGAKRTGTVFGIPAISDIPDPEIASAAHIPTVVGVPFNRKDANLPETTKPKATSLRKTSQAKPSFSTDAIFQALGDDHDSNAAVTPGSTPVEAPRAPLERESLEREESKPRMTQMLGVALAEAEAELSAAADPNSPNSQPIGRTNTLFGRFALEEEEHEPTRVHPNKGKGQGEDAVPVHFYLPPEKSTSGDPIGADFLDDESESDEIEQPPRFLNSMDAEESISESVAFAFAEKVRDLNNKVQQEAPPTVNSSILSSKIQLNLDDLFSDDDDFDPNADHMKTSEFDSAEEAIDKHLSQFATELKTTKTSPLAPEENRAGRKLAKLLRARSENHSNTPLDEASEGEMNESSNSFSNIPTGMFEPQNSAHASLFTSQEDGFLSPANHAAASSVQAAFGQALGHQQSYSQQPQSQTPFAEQRHQAPSQQHQQQQQQQHQQQQYQESILPAGLHRAKHPEEELPTQERPRMEGHEQPQVPGAATAPHVLLRRPDSPMPSAATPSEHVSPASQSPFLTHSQPTNPTAAPYNSAAYAPSSQSQSQPVVNSNRTSNERIAQAVARVQRPEPQPQQPSSQIPEWALSEPSLANPSYLNPQHSHLPVHNQSRTPAKSESKYPPLFFQRLLIALIISVTSVLCIVVLWLLLR